MDSAPFLRVDSGYLNSLCQNIGLVVGGRITETWHGIVFFFCFFTRQLNYSVSEYQSQLNWGVKTKKITNLNDILHKDKQTNLFSFKKNLNLHFTAQVREGTAVETKKKRESQELSQGDNRTDHHLNKRVERPLGTSLVTRSTEWNRRLIRLPQRDMMQVAQPVNTHLFMNIMVLQRTEDDGGLCECLRQSGV